MAPPAGSTPATGGPPQPEVQLTPPPPDPSNVDYGGDYARAVAHAEALAAERQRKAAQTQQMDRQEDSLSDCEEGVASAPGPVPFDRRGTQILGRYAEQDDEEGGLRDRNARALQRAKERGLAGPDLIAHATAEPGLNPYAVVNLDVEIQRGFRIKMLLLLEVQLVCMLGLAFTLRFVPSCKAALEVLFPAKSPQAVVLLAICVLSLPAIGLVKHRHPWNLVATAAWTILFSIFIAASDLPGGWFRYHSFFICILQLTAGVLVLAIFAQIRVTRKHESCPAGIPDLMSFWAAGCLAYVLWLAGSISIFCVLLNQGGIDLHAGAFVGATLFGSVLFAWVCYDAHKITCKMSPDEYMKAIVFFYTDMFYTCICCCMLCCAASAGAAPE